jgi:hypothetical protein
MARGTWMWVVAAALMVAGSLGAHLVGDLIGASPDGDHAEAARSGGHVLAGAAPLFAGVVIVLVVAAVFGLVAMRIAPSARRTLPWLVWMLPIAGLLIQEALERVTFAELPGFTAAHDPSTVTGMLVQVPFALVLVWLARRLVIAARAVVHRFARRMQHRLRRGPPRWRAPASVRLPRIASVALGYSQRGPPIPSS